MEAIEIIESFINGNISTVRKEISKMTIEEYSKFLLIGKEYFSEKTMGLILKIMAR